YRGIFAVNVGDRPHAPEQRLYLLLPATFLDGAIDVLANPSVLLKVSVDELPGFFLLDAKLLRQSEGRQPVDDPEVYCLGSPSMLGIDHQRRHAEDLGCCQG